MIYRPAEDSYFLRDFIEDLQLENRKFLEMGAGTGIIGKKANELGAEVTVADIDGEAVEYMENNLPNEIDTVETDLFQNISGKFDFIVFNPPYLSGDRENEKDALVGGEKGIKVTGRFLDNIEDYLTNSGVAYLIASSDSEVNELKKKYNLVEVGSKKLWFETLYILKTG